MSEGRFDAETLMAYADGELDPERAAEVEAAMADDPAIARSVRLFRETAVAARDAVDADTPPVPAALRASIEQAIARASGGTGDAAVASPAITPVARPTATPGRTAANRPWYVLAASVAVAAVALAAYLAGARRDDGLPPGGLAVVAPGAEQRAFQTALNEAASGTETRLGPATSVALTVSFRDRDGHLCREFRLEREAEVAWVSGVACRSAGSWSVAFAATRSRDAGDFRPASGHALLDAFLGERGASEPLSDTEEAAALRSPDPSP